MAATTRKRSRPTVTNHMSMSQFSLEQSQKTGALAGLERGLLAQHFRQTYTTTTKSAAGGNSKEGQTHHNAVLRFCKQRSLWALCVRTVSNDRCCNNSPLMRHGWQSLPGPS
eukprot:429975-Amphidinium_carterae.1